MKNELIFKPEQITEILSNVFTKMFRKYPEYSNRILELQAYICSNLIKSYDSHTGTWFDFQLLNRNVKKIKVHKDWEHIILQYAFSTNNVELQFYLSKDGFDWNGDLQKIIIVKVTRNV